MNKNVAAVGNTDSNSFDDIAAETLAVPVRMSLVDYEMEVAVVFDT